MRKYAVNILWAPNKTENFNVLNPSFWRIALFLPLESDERKKRRWAKRVYFKVAEFRDYTHIL